MHTSIITELLPSIFTDENIILGSAVFWIAFILAAIIIMRKRMSKTPLNQPMRGFKTLSNEVENLHREGALSESEYDKLHSKIVQREKKMKPGERTTLKEMKENAKKLYDEGYLSRENYQRLLKNLENK